MSLDLARPPNPLDLERLARLRAALAARGFELVPPAGPGEPFLIRRWVRRASHREKSA